MSIFWNRQTVELEVPHSRGVKCGTGLIEIKVVKSLVEKQGKERNF